ncbi:MAG: YheU family protein [Proteobacteria bacterium]|nr:YheU family protein [Pseudomonadota bacterium]
MAIEIPFEELSNAALRGVAEAFVLREGTEYGEHDYTLEQKVAHVIEQLRRGDAAILFDPDTETVAIVMRRELLVKTGKRRSADRDDP